MICSSDSIVDNAKWLDKQSTCRFWIGLEKENDTFTWFIDDSALKYSNFMSDAETKLSIFNVSNSLILSNCVLVNYSLPSMMVMVSCVSALIACNLKAGHFIPDVCE